MATRKQDDGQPDPRALDGALHPRENFSLIGHFAAEKQILDAWTSGRMHHAWLLTGMAGIGKATLAFRTARFILINPDPEAASGATGLAVPQNHPAAVKIAHGTHPNVLHVQREWDLTSKKFKSALGVDAVRRIIPFLGTTAGEGDWRFVIVDPADDMNRNAANALLKMLEEPPRQSMFFLICAAPGRLPPTIRSRCRTLHCSALTQESLSQIADQFVSGFDMRDDRSTILSLAGGSARRLIRLAGDDGHRMYNLLIEAFDNPNPATIAVVADVAAGSGPSGLADFLEMLSDYCGRRLRGTDEPMPSHVPPRLALASWAELWEKAARSVRDAQIYNLDVRHIVTAILETYAIAARQTS
jgi:DNA polymerase-3 subunit delta'